MDIFIILLLELAVIGITASIILRVGLSEAAEPQQSRAEDLASWERPRVAAERFRRLRLLVKERSRRRLWLALRRKLARKRRGSAA
jgi:hypothetical protein